MGWMVKILTWKNSLKLVIYDNKLFPLFWIFKDYKFAENAKDWKNKFNSLVMMKMRETTDENNEAIGKLGI